MAWGAALRGIQYCFIIFTAISKPRQLAVSVMRNSFMKLSLLISTFSFAITLAAQSDKPANPYLIFGTVWGKLNPEDSIALEDCKIEVLAEGKVIAMSLTNRNGDFKVNFPTSYCENKALIVRATHSDYSIREGPFVLYQYDYSPKSKRYYFILNKKE
jgi:hypothetical protein